MKQESILSSCEITSFKPGSTLGIEFGPLSSCFRGTLVHYTVSVISWYQCNYLTLRDFLFKVSNCSHEIKRCLFIGRKVMTNLESILKSRDITLPAKVCLVKAMVFPVVMYRCESWTIKKAECQRIDAFQLCWRRLESPLVCKAIQPVNHKGSHSWIFIGRTDAEAETPILWPPDAKNWLNGHEFE